MNFIFSKVFVNKKTVSQIYCKQCLYWLNFFFWVYLSIGTIIIWNYLVNAKSNYYIIFCKIAIDNLAFKILMLNEMLF